MANQITPAFIFAVLTALHVNVERDDERIIEWRAWLRKNDIDLWDVKSAVAALRSDKLPLEMRIFHPESAPAVDDHFMDREEMTPEQERENNQMKEYIRRSLLTEEQRQKEDNEKSNQVIQRLYDTVPGLLVTQMNAALLKKDQEEEKKGDFLF